MKIQLGPRTLGFSALVSIMSLFAAIPRFAHALLPLEVPVASSTAAAAGERVDEPAPAAPPASAPAPSSGTVSPRGAAQLELTTALPADFHDTERRLIARFSVDFAPVLGSIASGQTNVVGVPVDSTNLRESSTYLTGNLALGTRSLFYSTLNTYFLGGAGLDLSGVPGLDAPETGGGKAPSAQPSVYDRFPSGRALLLHLAYGELEGLTEEGALSHIMVRAGRQYHFGIVGVGFDGATIGYDDTKLHIMGRVGQRSAVFDRTADKPGIVAGANAGYAFDLGRGRALRFEAEYVHYQRDLTVTTRDQRVAGAGVSSVDLSTDLGELNGALDLTPNMLLTARLSFVRPEISHLGLGYEWGAGKFSLRVDLDEKVGKDLVYDLATVSGVRRDDVRTTYEALRLNIPDLQPFTDISAVVGYDVVDWLELEAHPGARIVHGDEANRTPYDATSVNVGGAVRGRFRVSSQAGVEATVGYDGTVYIRDESINEFRRLGGERVVHEVSIGTVYARGDRFIRGRMIGGRTLGVGLGGFLRSASFDNPLLTSSVSEGTYGLRASADWRFSTYASARVAYEFAQDSNLFTPYLGGFHHVRAGIEGRF